MDRKQQKKHLVCNKDDAVDDSDEDRNDDGVDDGAEGADKHLIHLLQVADYCRMDRNKQKEHLVRNKDDDVNNGTDDGDDD
eukprot:4292240-Ditylum_brightwellii.AAC.1